MTLELKDVVLDVMFRSNRALTVEQVSRKVAERLHGDIRDILNSLCKTGEPKSVHGASGHRTVYSTPAVERRI
jgi:hypothetical protein